MSSIFLTLAVVEALVTLLVVVEIARRAFARASRRAWIIGTLALLAVGAAVLAEWGSLACLADAHRRVGACGATPDATGRAEG